MQKGPEWDQTWASITTYKQERMQHSNEAVHHCCYCICISCYSSEIPTAIIGFVSDITALLQSQIFVIPTTMPRGSFHIYTLWRPSLQSLVFMGPKCFKL